MPKRKSDDYGKLYKKLKKLEKKLKRRCRSRSQSSDSASYEEPENSANSVGHELTENIAELLDGNTTAPEPADACATSCNIESCIAPTAKSASTVVSAVATTANASSTAAVIENLDNASPGEELRSTEVILANEILEILGEDPTISNTYGDEIHKDLAVRLEHFATHGLTKELRKELSEKYLLPSNCKLVNAPGLNAEIKASISDLTAKRDKSIELRQKQIATAISCLGQALNKLITNNNADSALVKILMDTERILCDCQHSDSTIRRNFILSTMKKNMKDQLQNTKPDNLLFGQNLTETIKTAKAINKTGAELKTPLPKPQANANNKKFPANSSGPSKNLNWKGPYPPRKLPNHPKTKGPPTSKNRQSNSSKHSQQHRTRDRQ